MGHPAVSSRDNDAHRATGRAQLTCRWSHRRLWPRRCKSGHPGQVGCAKTTRRRAISRRAKEIRPKPHAYRHIPARSEDSAVARMAFCNIRSSTVRCGCASMAREWLPRTTELTKPRTPRAARWTGSAPILLIGCTREPGAPETTALNVIARETYEMNRSVVNPNLRARPGNLHAALRERGPSRHFVLEALSAGPRLRPGAVRAAGERTPRRDSGVDLPARLAAAAAAHHPAQAAPVLVVAARQAGQRLACPAIPEDRRDHLAAPSALLHPRFRRRVLPGFRPVAVRISEFNSASDHERRGDRRTSRAIRAGSRPAINCSVCRRRRFRHRTSSATSYSGTSRPRARLASRIEAVTGLDWIEALCRTREFSEYMLYGYFVQNDPASAARHTVVPSTPCVSYWDDPTLSKSELNAAAPARQQGTTSPSRSRPSPARRSRPSAPRSPRATPSSRRPTPPTNLRGSPRYADRASQHQPDRQHPLGAAGAVERVHLHAAVLAA